MTEIVTGKYTRQLQVIFYSGVHSVQNDLKVPEGISALEIAQLTLRIRPRVLKAAKATVAELGYRVSDKNLNAVVDDACIAAFRRVINSAISSDAEQVYQQIHRIIWS